MAKWPLAFNKHLRPNQILNLVFQLTCTPCNNKCSSTSSNAVLKDVLLTYMTNEDFVIIVCVAGSLVSNDLIGFYFPSERSCPCLYNYQVHLFGNRGDYLATRQLKVIVSGSLSTPTNAGPSFIKSSRQPGFQQIVSQYVILGYHIANCKRRHDWS